MFKLVIFSALFGVAFSSCPAMNKAYKQGEQRWKTIKKAEDGLARVQPNDMGNVFFFQGPYTKEEFENFERTITLIFAEQNFTRALGYMSDSTKAVYLRAHSACLSKESRCSTIPIEKCTRNYRYRTITGACNNKANPKFGKSLTPYGRIASHNFDDGIFEVRRSVVRRKRLPRARHIANNAMTRNPFKCRTKFRGSMAGVMFGQFFAHDMGRRPMIQTSEGGRTRNCCSKTYSAPLAPQPFGCDAIEYNENDPFLAQIGVAPTNNIKCMSFVRTQVIFPNDCRLAPAMAVNMVSHFMDLSTVYGNDVEISRNLRTFKNGLLKTSEGNLLPRTCTDPNKNCYRTGDDRGIAFFTLGVWHIIYHRLHNLMAGLLKEFHPQYSDEKLYQEARRINIAIFQNHVMDWSRVFVGEPETKQFRPLKYEYLGRYKPHVDPSATVEFSHSAHRVFHSNLNVNFRLIDASNATVRSMSIDECDEGLVILKENIENVFRGLFFTFSTHDAMDAKVRNQLFNNDNPLNLGLDLISTDIQIGRDVGLQPYYVYFEKCTGLKVKSWSDLNFTIPAESIADLQKVYESVYDVDLYVGIQVEEKCDAYGGSVGQCIMVEQLERSRSGDRFFYSLPDGENPFTPLQLKTIYNFSISHLLCTVTELIEIPTRAFEVPGVNNTLVLCSSLKGLDLRPF